jgi:hypothetical protein
MRSIKVIAAQYDVVLRARVNQPGNPLIDLTTTVLQWVLGADTAAPLEVANHWRDISDEVDARAIKDLRADLAAATARADAAEADAAAARKILNYIMAACAELGMSFDALCVVGAGVRVAALAAAGDKEAGDGTQAR